MSQTTRYATLRDYLALLRRQRLLVVAITIAFAGAALGLSLSQTPSYEAESTVSFSDVSEDLRLLGVDISGSSLNVFQVAAGRAEEAASLDFARQVRKRLDTNVSAERLQGAVSTQVDVETGFVVLGASWDDADFAAQVANGYAAQLVQNETEDAEDRVDDAITDLEREAGGRVSPREIITDFEKAIQKQSLVRLRQVRDALDPADVSRRAEAPDSPSSPKTTRNTVLGGIVGLALALLAAFMRDSLDRRVRTPKDAHDELGFPVLGRVGKNALGSAGLASNGAIYIAPSDLEAFRILRTNMAILDTERPPRSVLVTSGLPEEGKSTVAASLASAAAAAGQQTLLVEADLRRPVLAKRMDVNEGPGLADYLHGDASPKDILQTVELPSTHRSANGASEQETQAAGDRRTLVCITAGTLPSEPAELLASGRCQDFVSKVAKAYDLVVFDSSPMLSTADPLELMPNMASVLVCVRLAASTRDEMRAVGSAIGLLPERPVGIVVTGGAADGYYGDYGYYA